MVIDWFIRNYDQYNDKIGQKVEILGTLGNASIEVKNEKLQEISKKINVVAEGTGVETTSSTQAMIS